MFSIDSKTSVKVNAKVVPILKIFGSPILDVTQVHQQFGGYHLRREVL